MKMTRTLGLLGGACFGLFAVLAVILARPADPGGLEFAAWAQHQMTIEQAYADFRATVAVLEVFDARVEHPVGDVYSVAAVTGDGVTLMQRIDHIEHGGRVKSVSSLVASPASRFSART